MKQYFKFDKNLRKLVAQLSVMIIVSFFLFYGYKSSEHFYFIILILVVFLFIFLLLYRLCFLNFIFEDDKVVFKSLLSKIEFRNVDIKSLSLISLSDRKLYQWDESYNRLNQKFYLVISKENHLKPEIYKFSLLSIANNERMILEYSDRMTPLLKNLKITTNVQTS